jgi:hypothetical protein
MDYEVIIPEVPSDEIPMGAAVLRTRGPYGFVATAPRPHAGFAEACAQALRVRRLVRLPEGCTTVGRFYEHDGELRVLRGHHDALERWMSRRLSRNDLEARDSLQQRRAEARSLAVRGRLTEAWALDRRLGF